MWMLGVLRLLLCWDWARQSSSQGLNPDHIVISRFSRLKVGIVLGCVTFLTLDFPDAPYHLQSTQASWGIWVNQIFSPCGNQPTGGRLVHADLSTPFQGGHL